MDRLPNHLKYHLPITDTSVANEQKPNADAPSLVLSQPEEVIADIIDKLDKADNSSLSSLVQTCQGLARIAKTDSLLSFFYAARSAYDSGNTEKKVEVFFRLVDWLQEVSGQLPDASVIELLDHLVTMSAIDGMSVADSGKLLQQTQVLFNFLNSSEKSSIPAIQSAFTQNTADTVRILSMSMRLMNQMNSLYKAAADAINGALQQQRAMFGVPHD